MKAWMIIALAVVALFVGGGLIAVLLVAGQYNKSVKLDEECTQSAGDVQSTYQRRLDLLPNLANTVERYAKHESGTLTAVAEARSMKPTITLTKDVLEDPEQMKKFQKQQGELASLVSRLISVQESYPNLKADEQFLNLQREIAGTENRINIARKDYNAHVAVLNENVRGFFSHIAADMAGVHKRTPFEADEGAQHAPKLFVDSAAAQK
jgi:LemA protein